nr:hypothetical protein [Laribacter hongkongensis]
MIAARIRHIDQLLQRKWQGIVFCRVDDMLPRSLYAHDPAQFPDFAHQGAAGFCDSALLACQPLDRGQRQAQLLLAPGRTPLFWQSDAGCRRFQQLLSLAAADFGLGFLGEAGDGVCPSNAGPASTRKLPYPPLLSASEMVNTLPACWQTRQLHVRQLGCAEMGFTGYGHHSPP